MFKHPIQYLDNTKVHNLSPVVCADLEMDTMYKLAFQPKHKYAKQMIDQWKTSFTSDTEYLQQTQQVVANCATIQSSDINEQNLDAVWTDVFETEGFCDRYCYIDIEQVKFVNENSTFMGFWTVANLLSPLISLVLPLLLLVAPFVLLKIQGVSIDFTSYINILKSLALKHSLGKALVSFDGTSLNGLMYLLFSIAMYGIQTYQNIKSCIRFYNNIYTINTNLITIQSFVGQSINNMKSFMTLNAGYSKYSDFCAHMSDQFDTLLELQRLIADVKPYSFGISKCFEIGNLLKCYFALQKYRDCIQYAMGFEGYLDNMRGINANANLTYVSYGSGFTCLNNQVYPPLITETQVKNTVNLSKATSGLSEATSGLSNNIIITGPNASGKTTVLKSTAINIIFSQQFGAGYFGNGSNINPYTHIHSYLNIPDTSGRDSLFQAEARRCKEILDIVADPEHENARHFCIFDELFSGTNAEEATLASIGFLKHLQEKTNVDFILTTHFTGVCEGVSDIQNMKMDATLKDNSIKFSYKLVPGISEIKAAKLILQQMGFPHDVLSVFDNDNA
jgi:hypothetical protein